MYVINFIIEDPTDDSVEVAIKFLKLYTAIKGLSLYVTMGFLFFLGGWFEADWRGHPRHAMPCLRLVK